MIKILAPMSIRFVHGAKEDAEFTRIFRPTSAHFGRMGQPEIITFGPERSRVTHGLSSVILIYNPGLRTVWHSISPGAHSPPFSRNVDAMLIVTKGEGARLKLGDTETELKEGLAIFIPRKVIHEIWNPGAQPAKFMVIMFGGDA
jgi:mannose-6-phosphate isomerase-like protein (cupin superfamily)